MGLVLKVCRARHYIPPQPVGEYGRYLAREFPDRDLFIYRHLETKNWVVAEWLSKSRGEAEEYIILGVTPRPTPKVAADLERMLRAPLSRKYIRESLKDWEHRNDMTQVEEDIERRKAMQRFFRDRHPGAGGDRYSVPLRFMPGIGG